MTGYSLRSSLWLDVHGCNVIRTTDGWHLEQFRCLVKGGIYPAIAAKSDTYVRTAAAAWVLVTTSLPCWTIANSATLVLGDILDITSDKAATERLRESEAAQRTAKEEAQRASAAKSRFLAAASHDLRQPTTVTDFVHRGAQGLCQGAAGLVHLEAFGGLAVLGRRCSTVCLTSRSWMPAW